ncbi:MAG: gfo/Idh/MocA family oxidoreductase [Flavobacteriia bacterium]|nr:MAG: gfo/Idh/MocA family oxidoreductase [Flavobacteriia bacterium]
MHTKIKLGFLGGGSNSLIGVLHKIASYMYDEYKLIGGVFNTDFSKSKESAEKIGLDQERVYQDLDTMIAEEIKLPVDERIQVVSVLTPNNLHFSMAKKLLENGFHVICEKPLTTTYAEALELDSIAKITQKVFAVTYTYTGYPMVRQMRQMIRSGSLGNIQKIDVQYYQGWINPFIHDLNKRAEIWRLDPEKSGISCCLGDIGSHAFQMTEYITGLKVGKVLADLNYLYEDNRMDVDGTVLFRTLKGVKGVIRASQIATGEENNFTVQVYGDRAGIRWEQENPNYLYFLEEGKPRQVLKPGHIYNSDLSLDAVKLPPGHPEGIFDAMANIYRGVAKAIKNEVYDEGEFPTINDGLRGMDFIEKSVLSHKKGNIWVDLD